MIGDRESYVSDVAAALDATEALIEVAEVADTGLQVIATRSSATRELVHTEKYATTPNRPRGTVRAVTADGFVTAVKLRDVSGTSAAVVYADPEACRLVCVLNDDTGAQGRWRDHRVELDLRPTPEWTLWTSNQGLKAQAAFAAVIEEGEAEITEPGPTVMLELAQTFHATTSAKFKQAGRLQDGRTQLQYEEEIDAKAGDGGALSIPAEFLLGLRPFFGADRYEVRARLRYRISRGDLQIGYFLHRAEDVRRKAFDELVESTRVALDLPFVAGSPAAPTSAVQ